MGWNAPALVRRLAFLASHPRARAGHPRPCGEAIHERIERAFGSILRELPLDADAYRNYRATCGYADRYASYMGPALLDQKLLEHFVSLLLLAPRSGETLLDVGGAVSPFADHVSSALGCRAMRLDLDYEPGVRGDRIGAPADAIPLPDSSVDAITLHCTIDHFEGLADTGFVREAGRVLRPGGRACVLPLYLAEHPVNVCDPDLFAASVRFDPEARVHRVPGHRNRFGRYYSVESLERRLLAPARAAGLLPTIHHVVGGRTSIPNNYLHYALSLERHA